MTLCDTQDQPPSEYASMHMGRYAVHCHDSPEISDIEWPTRPKVTAKYVMYSDTPSTYSIESWFLDLNLVYLLGLQVHKYYQILPFTSRLA